MHLWRIVADVLTTKQRISNLCGLKDVKANVHCVGWNRRPAFIIFFKNKSCVEVWMPSQFPPIMLQLIELVVDPNLMGELKGRSFCCCFFY